MVDHQFVGPGPELLPDRAAVEARQRVATSRRLQESTDPHEPGVVARNRELANDVHAQLLLGSQEVELEVLDEGLDLPRHDRVRAQLDKLVNRDPSIH